VGCRNEYLLPLLAVCATLGGAPTATLAQDAALPATPQTQTVKTAQLSYNPEQVGDALAAHQRYQAAIEAYRNAPHDSAEIWNKMGVAYQMMLNTQEASRCYRESIRLGPSNASVINNLGTIYDSLGEYRNAERMYRQALKIDPHSALILKNLGTNLLAQHRDKKGWSAYQSALAIDPLIFQNSSNLKVDNPANTRERGAMNYYMARGCARAGLSDRAVDYLRHSLNEGFTTTQKILADNEFASLRGLPAFDQLLSAQNSVTP
jgi:Tfp pilus assembly protein PilF